MILILTVLATGLALLAEGRYIFSILQGKSKPSFSGWLIFTLAMFCTFASAYALGARESLYLIGTFALLNTIITALSLKYGFVRFTRTDVVLFSLSLLGVFLWWQTANAWYTLVISVLIDMFGYLTMIKKLYVNPKTEDTWSWAMSVGAYGLNLALIPRWIPEEYLFSLSNFVWCGITFILTLRSKPKLLKRAGHLGMLR